MHHPNESDLALYAGNDLGRIARLRVDWHLRNCGKCQQEVTDFSSLRAETVRNASEPDVNWGRLAAEMKANIRLGLEAGECIAPLQKRHHTQSPWAWATLVTAALIAVAAGSEVWINHPWSKDISSGEAAGLAGMPPVEDVMLEVTDSGVRMRDGETVVSDLRNNSRADVVNSVVVNNVNAEGGAGDSYVDSKTGTVTVRNISFYGE